MFKTTSTLPEASRITLGQTLNARLQDGLDLHSQVKMAHWNVRGPQFLTLHPLFETLATELLLQTDTLAERAVTLGVPADATARTVAAQSRLAEYPRDVVRDVDHLRAIASRVDTWVAGLRQSRGVAEELKDTDTVDLLTGMVSSWEKHAWFLSASQAG